MYTYTEKPKKTDRSKKSNTIQRIKIRLDNTTHPPNNVLSHLEHFNFPNQGALVINANTLAGAGYRSNPSIGVAENIILLGHGGRPALRRDTEMRSRRPVTMLMHLPEWRMP